MPAWPAAAVLLIVAATAIRLRQYLFARPLWLDEAMLALAVAIRSWRELIPPLDYGQVAPLLFLQAQSLLLRTFGVHELSLRALPMAAGLVIPVLVWRSAVRLWGRAAGLLALGLAALAPVLVRYANEAKPYGVDALATAALVHLGLRALDNPSRGRLAALAGIGSILLLASFPAAFVAAGVMAALALDAGRDLRRLRGVAAVGAAWALTFGATYLAVYGSPASEGYLQRFWEAAFLDPGPGWRARAWSALRGTLLPVVLGNGSHVPGSATWVVLALAAAVIAGAVVLARAGRPAAVLLALPLLAALGAGLARRYPLGVPRTMAFAAPLVILLMVAAAVAVGRRLRRRGVPDAVLALAGLALLVPTAGQALADFRNPPSSEDAAYLVEMFRTRPRPEEPVYVSARGLPSWLFYTTNWESPHRERVRFYARAAAGAAMENGPSRGRAVRPQEAEGLAYRYRNREELLGLSTGREYRWSGWVSRAPDPGWATVEAQRVADAANPCAWVYFTRTGDGAFWLLAAELQKEHRGHPMERYTVVGGILARFCFAKPRPAPPPAPAASAAGS